MAKRFIDGELTPGKAKIVLDEEERIVGIGNFFGEAKQKKRTLRTILEKIAGKWFRRKEVFLGQAVELPEEKQIKVEKFVKKISPGKLKRKEIDEIEPETE